MIGKSQEQQKTVFADGFWAILGRDLFDQLGITFSQKRCPKTEVNAIELPRVLKQPLAKKFPELISQIANSKHHTVNSKFHKNYSVIYQN